MSGEVRAPAQVLVVDDDQVTREYVAGLLRGQGHHVLTAQDGQTAIDICTDKPISLVVLDVVMEGLSGVDCCRMLKTSSARRGEFLPVMLLTGRSDTESRVAGLRIGADDYLGKPFDARELIARSGNLVRIKRMHDDVSAAKERLEQLAIRDELTGLFNYRYLNSRLNTEFKRAERYREPLACAMIDIDHFKTFNDRFGHDVGDRVLRTVAERLVAAVREVDVVTRYGGEEFLLLLPNTRFAGALRVAERAWRSVGLTPFDISPTARETITISIGVGLYPSPGVTSREVLLKAADQGLYKAKDAGRNQICVFRDPPYLYSPDG